MEVKIGVFNAFGASEVVRQICAEHNLPIIKEYHVDNLSVGCGEYDKVMVIETALNKKHLIDFLKEAAHKKGEIIGLIYPI